SIIEAGVVGGGTMGVGIAVALLQAGLPVTLIERDSDALARGKGRIDELFDGFVAKNKMSPEQRTSALGRLKGSTSYDSLASADIIIEAVFEEMNGKK